MAAHTAQQRTPLIIALLFRSLTARARPMPLAAPVMSAAGLCDAIGIAVQLEKEEACLS